MIRVLLQNGLRVFFLLFRSIMVKDISVKTVPSTHFIRQIKEPGHIFPSKHYFLPLLSSIRIFKQRFVLFVGRMRSLEVQSQFVLVYEYMSLFLR